MKKRRMLRNVSLVALSAVLVGGTAMAFTGCGGGGSGGGGVDLNSGVLNVYIFCSEIDKSTNQAICDAWAARYNAENADYLASNGIDKVSVNLETMSNQEEYNDDLVNRFQNNTIGDIFYVSPKFVLQYAREGRILNLADYVLQDSESVASMNSIWANSRTFYSAYQIGGYYVNALASEYLEDGPEGPGYYDTTEETPVEVGIFGLPKDYSNFSMGYNKNYFTEEMKELYTTHKASDARSVKSRTYKANATDKEVTHDGSASDTFTYAASGSYKNPYTGETETVTEGEEAYIVNIGVPVKIKPFNYFRYENYTQAVNAGDPVATAVDVYTGGEGYTVTIPGFPGEDFEVTDEAQKNAEAPYDADTGHIVLTYAEYGALSWSLTYFLNTFAWDNDQNLTSGEGGVYLSDSGKWQNIYGGEQYENLLGPNLYVLPWLFSNDAAYIDTTSTKVLNEGTQAEITPSLTGGVEQYIGTDSEDVQKRTLDGGYRTAEVQYGINSANFVETYGAFHEHSSAWMGNSGQAGDCDSAASDKGGLSGWDYFRQGAALFYGAGTWDAGTRNNYDTDMLWFGQMPAPVSEKFALYSSVRSSNYDMELAVYSNAETAKGVGEAAGTSTGNTGDYAQRSKLSDGLKVYDESMINANQLKRQDKWGARMDSVGYAANSALGSTWKAAAAASLIMALTIEESAQVTLTYGGAQLPNVAQQCTEFLDYQSDEYKTTGAFSGMITPDGDSEGRDVWDEYYQVARDMAKAAREKSGQTVAQFLADKTITVNGATEAVKYDEQYADVQLVNFIPGEGESCLAYAMRVLRMVNMAKNDRDLNIRMQYGMNAAQDQLMYTPGTTWIEVLDTSTESITMAYINQKTLEGDAKSYLPDVIVTDAQTQVTSNSGKYLTPAALCVRRVLLAQQRLDSGV